MSPSVTFATAGRRRGTRLLLLAGMLAALAACGTPAGSGDFAFESPAPEGSRLPHLSLDARAQPVLSWVEEREHGHALSFAVLGSSGWEAPVTVASGDDWFVNWADFPSVQPLGDELWAAHWLVKQPGGMYAYDIALSLSEDGGTTWNAPFRPHHDDTATEHGFVSLWPVRRADGTAALGAAWLDGRHTLVDPSRPGNPTAPMVLMSAVFDASGSALSSTVVDDRVCECCQTDVALIPTGALVAYRDRSNEEIRDVQVAASTTEGWNVLGTVAEDGWHITGCPVNGPAIAARNDQIVVAWYTEAGGRGRVQLARRGSDEARRGAEEARLDSEQARWSPPVVVDGDAPMGRVDVALLDDGDAAVSWMAAAPDQQAWILLARVGRDGAVAEPLRIAATEHSRPAGFPRMIRHDGALLLAWTQWQEGVPRVVTARVEPAELPSPGA